MVVPIELTELIWRTNADTDFLDNSTNLGEEVDEVINQAALRETSLKQKIAASHGKKVVNREFEVGDLVLRRNQKDYEEGKDSKASYKRRLLKKRLITRPHRPGCHQHALYFPQNQGEH